MEAAQTAPGVYAVITPTRDLPNTENRGWNSNSAFVVTADGVLLIDSGSSQAIGESLRRVIAGVTSAPGRGGGGPNATMPAPSAPMARRARPPPTSGP